MKLFSYIRFVLICSIVLLANNLFANVYTPDQILNPNLQNRYVYVSDLDNYLNEETEKRVNNILYNLRINTGAEVGVVVVSSTGDLSVEEFSDKIFSSWKLGKSDKDNGLLLLVAVEDRTARLTTGYGLEGLIPDITAYQIINSKIAPNMKKGDVDTAIIGAVESINSILSDPEAADELKSNQKEAWEKRNEAPVSSSDLFKLIIILALAMFVLSVILLIRDNYRFKKLDNHERALAWHNRRPLYLILSIFSLGLGLPVYLITERKRKKSRDEPVICENCKTRMVKLNEEEDNALLSPSQDLEEKLDTVDYDVWLCPECGSVERYPFKTMQTQYSSCPYCGTIAYHLVKDHTLKPATTTSTGIGERIYRCEYCHHNRNDRYVIPRKESALAAGLVAGAILGSHGRGGGNFGGGIGGGFGGGRTGGGGASGRW